MSREITNAAVIGLGTMGAGLAEVLSRQGIQVVAVEVDEKAVERGRARVAASSRSFTSAAKARTSSRIGSASGGRSTLRLGRTPRR